MEGELWGITAINSKEDLENAISAGTWTKPDGRGMKAASDKLERLTRILPYEAKWTQDEGEQHNGRISKGVIITGHAALDRGYAFKIGEVVDLPVRERRPGSKLRPRGDFWYTTPELYMAATHIEDLLLSRASSSVLDNGVDDITDEFESITRLRNAFISSIIRLAPSFSNGIGSSVIVDFTRREGRDTRNRGVGMHLKGAFIQCEKLNSNSLNQIEIERLESVLRLVVLSHIGRRGYRKKDVKIAINDRGVEIGWRSERTIDFDDGTCVGLTEANLYLKLLQDYDGCEKDTVGKFVDDDGIMLFETDSGNYIVLGTNWSPISSALFELAAGSPVPGVMNYLFPDEKEKIHTPSEWKLLIKNIVSEYITTPSTSVERTNPRVKRRRPKKGVSKSKDELQDRINRIIAKAHLKGKPVDTKGTAKVRGSYQDIMRDELLNRQGEYCMLTGRSFPESCLQLAHHKPCCECDNDYDKANYDNVFLIDPTTHHFYEHHFVAYDKDGIRHLSSRLNPEEKARLSSELPENFPPEFLDPVIYPKRQLFLQAHFLIFLEKENSIVTDCFI